jgi:hypothetical protein
VNRNFLRLAAVAGLVTVTLAAPSALRAESFLESDDYKEGEEVVNVFLKEGEYAIMVEEFARNGQEFDWGWVLTPGWAPVAAPAAEEGGGGVRARMRRRSGPKLEANPKQLGFSMSDYKTAYVAPVANFAGIVRPEELEQIHEALTQAIGQMGLKPAGAGEADLVLESALVDLGREGGGFGLIQVQPFIELELRIKERANDRALFLARTQKHAPDAFDASLTLASQVALVLR